MSRGGDQDGEEPGKGQEPAALRLPSAVHATRPFVERRPLSGDWGCFRSRPPVRGLNPAGGRSLRASARSVRLRGYTRQCTRSTLRRSRSSSRCWRGSIGIELVCQYRNAANGHADWPIFLSRSSRPSSSRQTFARASTVVQVATGRSARLGLVRHRRDRVLDIVSRRRRGGCGALPGADLRQPAAPIWMPASPSCCSAAVAPADPHLFISGSSCGSTRRDRAA